MMTTWLLGAASPFANWAEFESALDGPTSGAIYTFADRPALNGIALVVAALVFIYFLYSTFHTKYNDEPHTSPTSLGAVILAGMVSLASAVYDGYAAKEVREASTRRSDTEAIAKGQRQMPAFLAGLVGLGAAAPSAQRKRSKRRRKVSRDRYTRF
jgi:hypothetical protein